MDDTSLERLRSVFRKVFRNPEMELTRSLTAADVEEWDSLTHINLIVGVEREFKLKFTTAEISRLNNVGDLMDLVDRKRPVC